MVKLLTILFLLICSYSEAQTTFFLEAGTNTQYGASGTISTWTSSGSVVNSSANPTGFKSSSTIATQTLAVNNSSSTATTLFAQFISPALKAQTISGTITSAFARMSIANATGATVQSRMKITVISRTGAVVATLLALTSGAANLTTTLTSIAIVPAGTALTSYSCADGDRICIEIGIGRSAGTTARNGGISFGSSSGTNITATGSTTANNPVVTFSGNIQFLKGVPFTH